MGIQIKQRAPLGHRIDAPIVYISAFDDVWDHDRIDREKKIIRGEVTPLDDEVIPWHVEEDHPVVRYGSGKSRYDIATVRDYFAEGVTPTEFHLRRVKISQWTQIQHLLEQARFAEAKVLAISMTLDKIEGADIPLSKRKPGRPLSDDDLQTLRESIGDNEFNLLGWACISANSELSEDEKKH